MKKLVTIVLLFLFWNTLESQNNIVHLIGIKGAYNLSSVSFNPIMEEASSVTTIKNYSISYIYFHNLWNSMPYFGFQTELYFQEQGYTLDGERIITKAIEVPFTSKFHIDFWKMRLLMNAGAFVGYRTSKSNGFEATDYRYDYGFLGGGGLGFVMKPIEIHFEANYHYSLAYMYDPAKVSDTKRYYSHPRQLLLSVAVYFNLFSK